MGNFGSRIVVFRSFVHGEVDAGVQCRAFCELLLASWDGDRLGMGRPALISCRGTLGCGLLR